MNTINPFKSIYNIENKKLEFKELGFLGGLFVAILYAFSIYFVAMARLMIDDNSIILYAMSLLILIAYFFLIIFLLVDFYTWPVDKSTNKNISRKRIKFSNLIYIILFILGFSLILNVSLSPFYKNIQGYEMYENNIKSLLKVPIFMIAYEIVLGPIMEEVLCRGIILNGFLKRHSKVKAVVFSALIFGIMHQNILQFIVAFLLGLFLGYVYIKTESILLCIFCHCTNNALCLIIRIFYPNFDLFFSSMSTIAIVGSCILGLFIIILSIKNMKNMEIKNNM